MHREGKEEGAIPKLSETAPKPSRRILQALRWVSHVRPSILKDDTKIQPFS